MASQSDQIQADIARTRARMSTRLEQGGSSYQGGSYQSSSNYQGRGYQGGSGGTGSGLVEQIRSRPLVALGLSLIAGSLLQDYLGSNQSTSTGRQVGRAGDRLGYEAQRAGQTAANTARGAVDTARDLASDAADTVSDAASSAANTVGNLASGAVDTVGDVAHRVGDTVGNVAGQVGETASDVAEGVYENAGDLFSAISEQIRERPLIALGLSLAAGSLLQSRMGGGQAAAPRVSGRGSYRGSQGYGAYADSYDYDRRGSLSQAATTAGQRVGDAVEGAGQTVANVAQGTVDTARNVVSGAVDTVGDVASTAADAASNVASTAVDAAGNLASTAADTASTVAHAVGDTASNVAHQVSETAGDAAEWASDTFSSLTRLAQERPLATLGVSIAAGMLLQPTLSPHVTAISNDVRAVVRSVGSTVGDLVNIPEPPELERIRAALVPATVERSKQYVSRDLREYLESSLEGMVGQTSLRAGVVAAATERAEAFVDKRLPNLLNSLSGPVALLTLGLVSSILEARHQVQQQGDTNFTTVKAELGRTIAQQSQEQLSRYFPEFRDQLQATEASQQSCSNCNTQLQPNSRFCPNCGTPVGA